MSRWYRFLYKIGFKPWGEDQESLAPQFNLLVELEEQDREPPYGPALDLGCGTGRWSVVLARRGWQVVGIDVVPDATMLILVWSRARRGPLPPGASREDLETAFPGWRIVDQYPYSGDLPWPLKRISPHWYRLARS